MAGQVVPDQQDPQRWSAIVEAPPGGDPIPGSPAAPTRWLGWGRWARGDDDAGISPTAGTDRRET
jgi:hypothetical protein